MTRKVVSVTNHFPRDHAKRPLSQALNEHANMIRSMWGNPRSKRKAAREALPEPRARRRMGPYAAPRREPAILRQTPSLWGAKPLSLMAVCQVQAVAIGSGSSQKQMELNQAIRPRWSSSRLQRIRSSMSLLPVLRLPLNSHVPTAVQGFRSIKLSLDQAPRQHVKESRYPNSRLVVSSHNAKEQCPRDSHPIPWLCIVNKLIRNS